MSENGEESGVDAGIYARVSTSDQDEARQIQDCRDALEKHPYEIESVDVYADVMTGTTTEREDYGRLLDDVTSGDVDLVIATEVSRLSRSGAQDVMHFISTCLENDAGVEFTQSPVSLRVEMDEITKSIQRTIVSLLSELANVEHKQKMSRIRSGIKAAQSSGKWTGRPPKGFVVDDATGYLRVDPVEFLETRAALERVVGGESIAAVSRDSGIPESTLRKLRDDRLELYFAGDADDDRVDAALEDVRPLDEPDVERESSELSAMRERLDELETLVDGSGSGSSTSESGGSTGE
jgi:DNA invertase Pin-like site-specific DNA recombinase